MERIKMNEKLVDTFFSGLDADCKEEVKKMVKENNCVLDAETGELIKNETGTGIYTDYFKDAIFQNHRFRRFEIENLYGIGCWVDEEETQRIMEQVDGSDGWNLYYNQKNKEEKKVWRFTILHENEEMSWLNIWFDKEEKAIVCDF